MPSSTRKTESQLVTAFMRYQQRSRKSFSNPLGGLAQFSELDVAGCGIADIVLADLKEARGRVFDANLLSYLASSRHFAAYFIQYPKRWTSDPQETAHRLGSCANVTNLRQAHVVVQSIGPRGSEKADTASRFVGD